MLFLHFTGGCGGYDGHHQGVPFQSCYDGALTNTFFMPAIYIFCSQIICNYCESPKTLHPLQVGEEDEEGEGEGGGRVG